MPEEDATTFVNLNWMRALENETSGNSTTGPTVTTTALPHTIFFLFGVFAVGAFIKFIQTKIRLPYTVVLFVLGGVLGLISLKSEKLKEYTEIARMNPTYILYIFLPILIFESAFALDSHIFLRCSTQCLLLAGPGVVICAALTAILSVNFFSAYEWSWPVGFLLGSILGSTDPVAVVALLRESGASKTLSTLIEGESLLNDGSAIVAYMVFVELAVPGAKFDAGDVIWKFCRISLGGPAFGFLMGKLTIFCLTHVFNDTVIEISITLTSAYLTYYIAEAMLSLSGVLAVVVLGIVINVERNRISPEVEMFVCRFWANMAHFANTLIFVIVGIVVTTIAADHIEKEDWWYVIATYIGNLFFRLIMVAILSPVLVRIGYGLQWQEAIVVTWGGLRGAVGLVLALLASEYNGIDKDKVGNKIIIHVSGVVLLTLLVNATTIQFLLRKLGMNSISDMKRANMANVIIRLREIQDRSIHVHKGNQFLADADWKNVELSTQLYNPYVKKSDKENEEEIFFTPVRFSVCPDCTHEHVVEPTPKELDEMFNEARLRFISAQKVSYWRQFEKGMLAKDNVRLLLSAADVAADKPGSFITVTDLRKSWTVPRVYTWLAKKLEKKEKVSKPCDSDKEQPTGWRAQAKKLMKHFAFEYLIYIIIILNMVIVVTEIALKDPTEQAMTTLHVLNIVFVGLYLIELLVKVIVFGVTNYFRSHWNKFDFLILTLAVSDVTLQLIADISLKGTHEAVILRTIAIYLGLMRALRMFKLTKLLRSHCLSYINSRINDWLYAGYDIGCSFMMGEEEVMNVIKDIVDYPPIGKQLQQICQNNRTEIVKELATLQEQHPSVAIAVKSRHVAREVLNCSRDELNQLKEQGLLDDATYELIHTILEENMKRLLNAPISLMPTPPLDLLKNVDWIQDNEDIFNYLKNKALVVKFPKGKVISAVGDKPSGIYIITMGIVKISGQATPSAEGRLPNTDSFLWFSSENYFEDRAVSGNVLGELGILTGKPYSTTTVCEAEVQAFHISQENMEKALVEFNENVSVEYRMWRTCGVKIAKTVLGNIPQYDDWSQSQIMMHLEKAFLPDIRSMTSLQIDSELQDVILIQGKATDSHTNEVFKAVTYIPRTVSTLKFEAFQIIRPLLVIVGPFDDEIPQMDKAIKRDRWSTSTRCLLHHVRRSNSIKDQAQGRDVNRENSITSWNESLGNFYQRKTSVYSMSDGFVPQRRDSRLGMRSAQEQFLPVHSQKMDIPVNKHMSRILEDTGSIHNLNCSVSTLCTDVGSDVAISVDSDKENEKGVFHLQTCDCVPPCSGKHSLPSSSL